MPDDISRSGPHAELRDRYLAALVAGDREGAAAVVGECLRRNVDPAAIYLDVLAAAQREIGERWHRGELSVAREHWATEATFEEIERVRRARPAARPNDRSAVVGAVAGERHGLAPRIVAALLDGRGWRVDLLGADLPSGELADFVADRAPNLVALSVTLVENLPVARQAVDRLAALDPRPRIIVGGAAFGSPPKMPADLTADAVADGTLEGIAVAERLVGLGGPPDLPGYLAVVGQRIQQLRHESGLSQAEVARLATLTRPYLSAVEQGRQNITLEAALKIAGALRVPIARLLDGDR